MCVDVFFRSRAPWVVVSWHSTMIHASAGVGLPWEDIYTLRKAEHDSAFDDQDGDMVFSHIFSSFLFSYTN